jgi:[ribosomal protein S18]-alanine N-acetyltransferase
VIRAARESDLPRVFEIETASHDQPWSQHAFFEELSPKPTRPLFFVHGDPAEAYIVAWRIAGELQIQNVTTAPDYRRRGLARELLQHVLVLAGDCHFATLEVREGNFAARVLYESLGFVEVGRRPRYYTNGETAVLMQRG